MRRLCLFLITARHTRAPQDTCAALALASECPFGARVLGLAARCCSDTSAYKHFILHPIRTHTHTHRLRHSVCICVPAGLLHAQNLQQPTPILYYYYNRSRGIVIGVISRIISRSVRACTPRCLHACTRSGHDRTDRTDRKSVGCQTSLRADTSGLHTNTRANSSYRHPKHKAGRSVCVSVFVCVRAESVLHLRCGSVVCVTTRV